MAVSFSTAGTQQILMPNIPLPANLNAFTFMCYVLPSENKQTAIICGQTNGTGNNSPDFTLMTVSNNNRFRVKLRTGSTVSSAQTGNRVYTPNTDSSMGERYHLCAIYNGSTLKIFVDGVEEASSNVSGNVTSTSNKLFCISGVPNRPASEEFAGVVEDVRIYAKAFSQKELDLILSSNGHDGLYDNLVVWYRLNEQTTGTIPTSEAGSVKDYGPNEYNGKTNGASPSWVRPHVWFTKKQVDYKAKTWL